MGPNPYHLEMVRQVDLSYANLSRVEGKISQRS